MDAEGPGQDSGRAGEVEARPGPRPGWATLVMRDGTVVEVPLR